MTEPVDIAELQRLEAAATKGPWSQPFGDGDIDAYANNAGWSGTVCSTGTPLTADDAALIVAMRNALPDLLARLEALAAEREGMIEALEWALDNAGTEHPHYPERSDVGGWHYPYLVNGSPMGGGVGHAHFATAVEAVLSARAALSPQEPE